MKINLKNEYTIAAGKLGLVAFVGILLVCIAQISVYALSQKREALRTDEFNKKLFPEAETFASRSFLEQKKGVEFFHTNKVKVKNEYYEAQDSSGGLLGYIVFVSGNGDFSELPLYIAFSDKLQIKKVLLMPTKELRGKCWEDSKLLSIFEGTNTQTSPFPPQKPGNEAFDSVSGATITFNGIVEAVKESINLLSDKGR